MKKLHLILLGILVFLIVGCSCGKPTYKVTLDQNVHIVTEEIDAAKIKEGTEVLFEVKVPEGKALVKALVNNAEVSVDANNQFKVTVEKDLSIYAVIKKIVTVTFDVDGGSPVAPQTIIEGEAASKPADPEKEGYIFKGWFLGSSAQNPFGFSRTINDNLTLYARWVKEHTVTFELNNGAENVIVKVEDGKLVLEPDQPEKADALFKGWYLDGTVYDFETPVGEDIIISAVYQDEIMVVEDRFFVPGRGIVLQGTLKQNITTDQDIDVYSTSLDQMFTVKICGIQINNTIVESAEVGDKVGILLSSVEGLTKDDLARGDIVYVHIP